MDELINKTNKVLKAGLCGLTIEIAERKLRLRGTLPLSLVQIKLSLINNLTLPQMSLYLV
jgi:hypothetical protein